MSDHRNHLGQPLGVPVPGWTGAAEPSTAPMVGRYCRVVRLDPETHAEQLFEANRVDPEGANWTYLPYGPFDRMDGYLAWLHEVSKATDPLFFAVVDVSSERAAGVASYLRIARDAGSIEVGNINYSPLLQRSRAGTEAMYLMMRRVFDECGYRRYEWKCNSRNAKSMAAAQRLGFRFEGIFRNSQVVKGHNRDTAWFSVTDDEWPRLRTAFEGWLDPANFRHDGSQRQALRAEAPHQL
ncbi:MAG: GNAT family N-acetyltransferase [Actinomycetota bacterium]|nr:GNAT family N-acetyltransferase [Actinomycetota bacterium]MDH5277497.1 GNAT family N-acetyltransferase [Actinomycetota bacterium]